MLKITKVNNSSLSLLYYIFNKLLFNGKLPKVIVRLANLSKQEFRGCYAHGESGKPIAILIDKNDKDPVRVLVHEMVHVYIVNVRKIMDGPDHPPSFVRKLRSCYKKLGLGPPSKLEVSG